MTYEILQHIKLTRSQIIGYFLKCERIKQGKSQGSIAKALGLQSPMVSRYESGQAMMNVSMLWQFCKALHIKSSVIVMRACEAEAAFEKAGGNMVFQREAGKIEPTLCTVAMHVIGFGYEEKRGR